MPKVEKIESVAELKQLFEEANAFFVTDYQGLNVEDINALRKTLRQKKVKYVVAKNTLIRIAAHQANVPDIDKHLKGPTAVAFTSEDPAAAAKVLNDSFKDKERPKMKAFVVDKHLHQSADIGRLADLPSREVLLSQVVGAVEAPLTSLVGTLDNFFQKLIGTVDALAEKKKSE